MSDYYQLLTTRLLNEEEIKELTGTKTAILSVTTCAHPHLPPEEAKEVEITLKMENLMSMVAVAGSFGNSRKLHWKATGMVLDQALISLPIGLSKRTTTENELLAAAIKKFVTTVHREISLQHSSFNGKPWTVEILFKFRVDSLRLQIDASSSRYQETPSNKCVEIYKGVSVTISI